MTTVGTLPSRRVILHDVRRRGRNLPVRYYDPLGFPLSSARFRLRLIRATLPRRRQLRRASRVPHISLHTCCAPYPAGTSPSLRFWRGRCRLRRDMSGSAPRLFLCRGCRLHFMLRPACLLPAARLPPPHGLLTSRSGQRALTRCLGPATRRSGAYRDGTLTRWRCAAWRRTSPLRGRTLRFAVTAHHAQEPSHRGAHATSTSDPHALNHARDLTEDGSDGRDRIVVVALQCFLQRLHLHWCHAHLA